MKFILSFLFLTGLAYQNTALASCESFTLVKAQEISTIIAQNPYKLRQSGKIVEANDICISKSSGENKWSVSVNCSKTRVCKPINVGTYKIKSDYAGEDKTLAEMVNLDELCPVQSSQTIENSNNSQKERLQ